MSDYHTVIAWEECKALAAKLYWKIEISPLFDCFEIINHCDNVYGRHQKLESLKKHLTDTLERRQSA